MNEHISRTIEYIEQNLTISEMLTLSELAWVAGYTHYPFVRRFFSVSDKSQNHRFLFQRERKLLINSSAIRNPSRRTLQVSDCRVLRLQSR